MMTKNYDSDQDIIIYGYVDGRGNHVNLSNRVLGGGCPIVPIENDPYGEPAPVQFYRSEDEAEWDFHSFLNRYLAFSDQLYDLTLVVLDQEWLNSGNYTLVPALRD